MLATYHVYQRGNDGFIVKEFEMSPTLNISIRLSIVFTIYLIEELHITFLNAKYIVTEKFR